MPMRILIADTGTCVNHGLTGLLSEFEGLCVFGCVQEQSKVLALVATLQPDIVILDLGLSWLQSLDTLKQIKVTQPSAVIIVLSDYEEPLLKDAAIKIGASHFFIKTELDQLLKAINSLVQNHEVMRDDIRNQRGSVTQSLSTPNR